MNSKSRRLYFFKKVSKRFYVHKNLDVILHVEEATNSELKSIIVGLYLHNAYQTTGLPVIRNFVKKNFRQFHSVISEHSELARNNTFDAVYLERAKKLWGGGRLSVTDKGILRNVISELYPHRGDIFTFLKREKL